MKLSMKSRYGLRALIDLAINQKLNRWRSTALQSGIRYLHSIWNRYLQVLEKQES